MSRDALLGLIFSLWVAFLNLLSPDFSFYFVGIPLFVGGMLVLCDFFPDGWIMRAALLLLIGCGGVFTSVYSFHGLIFLFFFYAVLFDAGALKKHLWAKTAAFFCMIIILLTSAAILSGSNGSLLYVVFQNTGLLGLLVIEFLTRPLKCNECGEVKKWTDH